MVTDSEGTSPRIFAKGTRNSPFMVIRPDTSEVWATEMGRDLLGDNIPPEEINILEDGKSYGWPNCYGRAIHDDTFDTKKEHSCQETIPPIYEFQAHSAPLGLTFIKSPLFSDTQQGDLLIAYHGSWNRSTPTGYKVVRMKVEGKHISGDEDFVTGFIEGSSAKGRPVDIEFDTAGRLYISDDKAGAVYVVGTK